MVKVISLAIMFGLAFQGMRQPKGYFGEFWRKTLWSLSDAPQLLTKCASSVLNQGISFVGGLVGSCANWVEARNI